MYYVLIRTRSSQTKKRIESKLFSAPPILVHVVVIAAAFDDSVVVSCPLLRTVTKHFPPGSEGFLPTKFGPETLINCTDSRAPQPTRRGSKLRPNRTKIEVFNIFFPSLNIRHTTVSLPALIYFFVRLKLA